MNFKRYALTLFLVPVLFFSARSYAQNISSDTTATHPVLPFEINIIEPSGTTTSVSGSSSSQKLADIIDDLDVILYSEDKISVFPDLYMQMGGRITLQRAPKINLTDGKKKTLYRSWAGTVQDLLSQKKIELGADDTVVPGLETVLVDGDSIKINRVAKTTVIDKQEIAFKIIKKDDPNLKYGKTRTEVGEKGQKELTYMVTRIDGEEVSRVLLNSAVTKQAKDEIHYTGTKVVVLSSVSGKATIGPNFCNIVSASYPKGTLVRITNLSGRASLIDTVDCTWGTASAPDGVVLDLSRSNLTKLKWNGLGKGPSVLVEEIER